MKKALVASLAVVAAAGAHAAMDASAALMGVADAQTAVLLVLGAMITMASAIFGLKKVLALLGR